MTYRLLLVDDEEEVREVLPEIVDWSGLGFEVIGTLEDGQEAIAYLQKFEVDVILSDIKMTFQSGLDIAAYIHRRKLRTRVVLLSGYQEFELAKEAIRYNVKDYLLKPTDLDELYKVFRTMKEELDQAGEAARRKEERNQDRDRGYIAYLLFHTEMGPEEVVRQMQRQGWSASAGHGPCLLLHAGFSKKSGAPLSEHDRASCKMALEKALGTPNPARPVFVERSGPEAFQAVVFSAGGADGGPEESRHTAETDAWLRAIEPAMRRFASIAGIRAAVEQPQRFDMLAPLLDACRKPHAAAPNTGVTPPPQAVPKKSDGKYAIRHAKAYIHDHYMDNLSLEVVAAQIYLNPVYFGHLFKQETQKNFSDYLLEVRLGHAKELLRTSALKIYEVCERVGYKDIKHFYKLFKRHVGVTPSEYRDGQQPME
ncbi:response regulator [Paenibacillus sp. IB182496]|uniref:Response regulator n=1 Tax=Paenibacillus sabuli TaxID=2772509 RepID=A0A927BQQ0_9BACL|nr:response regulator [Paenibacillus sabuli]MBD2843799.1 response regulator [Paenibacillus sabuli]